MKRRSKAHEALQIPQKTERKGGVLLKVNIPKLFLSHLHSLLHLVIGDTHRKYTPPPLFAPEAEAEANLCHTWVIIANTQIHSSLHFERKQTWVLNHVDYISGPLTLFGWRSAGDVIDVNPLLHMMSIRVLEWSVRRLVFSVWMLNSMSLVISRWHRCSKKLTLKTAIYHNYDEICKHCLSTSYCQNVLCWAKKNYEESTNQLLTSLISTVEPKPRTLYWKSCTKWLTGK